MTFDLRLHVINTTSKSTHLYLHNSATYDMTHYLIIISFAFRRVYSSWQWYEVECCGTISTLELSDGPRTVGVIAQLQFMYLIGFRVSEKRLSKVFEASAQHIFHPDIVEKIQIDRRKVHRIPFLLIQGL